jgi:hypothetical protein
MKTLAALVSGKKLFSMLAFLFITAIVFVPYANAQFPSAITSSSSDSIIPTQGGKSAVGFQSLAFPMLTPMQVRVVFQNLTPYQVHVSVSNDKNQIIYSKVYRNTPKYYGVIDFSQFPAGKYTFQVSCGPKIGKVKYRYTQTFQICLHTEHSIIAWDRNQSKKLYKRRAFVSNTN